MSRKSTWITATLVLIGVGLYVIAQFWTLGPVFYVGFHKSKGAFGVPQLLKIDPDKGIVEKYDLSESFESIKQISMNKDQGGIYIAWDGFDGDPSGFSVFDTYQTSIIDRFPIGEGVIRNITYSSQAEKIYVDNPKINADKLTFVIDSKTGRRLKKFSYPIPEEYIFSKDGNYVYDFGITGVVGSDNYQVYRGKISLEKGTVVSEFEGVNNVINHGGFQPDPPEHTFSYPMIYSAGPQGRLQIIDRDTLEKIKIVDFSKRYENFLGFSNSFHQTVFDDEKTLLFIAGYNEGGRTIRYLHLFDLNSYQTIKRIRLGEGRPTRVEVYYPTLWKKISEYI